MQDLNLVQVTALTAFTKTTRHGQFHGDPDSKRNARPKVPDYVVEDLKAAGLIAIEPRELADGERLVEGVLPDGLESEAIDAPTSDPLDHDDDGKKGGSKKGAASTAAKGKAAKASKATTDAPAA